MNVTGRAFVFFLSSAFN